MGSSRPRRQSERRPTKRKTRNIRRETDPRARQEGEARKKHKKPTLPEEISKVRSNKGKIFICILITIVLHKYMYIASNLQVLSTICHKELPPPIPLQTLSSSYQQELPPSIPPIIQQKELLAPRHQSSRTRHKKHIKVDTPPNQTLTLTPRSNPYIIRLHQIPHCTNNQVTHTKSVAQNPNTNKMLSTQNHLLNTQQKYNKQLQKATCAGIMRRAPKPTQQHPYNNHNNTPNKKKHKQKHQNKNKLTWIQRASTRKLHSHLQNTLTNLNIQTHTLVLKHPTPNSLNTIKHTKSQQIVAGEKTYLCRRQQHRPASSRLPPAQQRRSRQQPCGYTETTLRQHQQSHPRQAAGEKTQPCCRQQRPQHRQRPRQSAEEEPGASSAPHQQRTCIEVSCQQQRRQEQEQRQRKSRHQERFQHTERLCETQEIESKKNPRPEPIAEAPLITNQVYCPEPAKPSSPINQHQIKIHMGSHPGAQCLENVMRREGTATNEEDLDMELENVSPAQGSSSLRYSISQSSPIGSQRQLETTLATTNLEGNIPSAKRRKPDGEERRTPINTQQEEDTTQRTRSKGAALGIDILAHMWLGFPIHEAIALERGKLPLREKRTNYEFECLGTPPSEIIEFRTLRHAFPRVAQKLFPNERPDAVPGQHFHFTQVPHNEKTNQETGLSEGYQITIRFDMGFKSMNRNDVKNACLARLHKMAISLGTDYTNSLDIGSSSVTKNWAGFIKIHLKRPHVDGIALLRGTRAFALELEGGEMVIGKVEKGYELVTQARNLRLHLKGDTLRDIHAHSLFRTLVRESYYEGKQHEFMSLTKPDATKDFAFLTLLSEETRDTILTQGLHYHHEKIRVSITRGKEVTAPSELRISTTLVANNLPQKESQTSIVMTLKKKFGDGNIVGFNFGNNVNHAEDKQAGWCHIQCLNAAVYTEWIHKSIYIFGRRVDFIPHKGSIDGTDPNKTAIRLAQAPAREAIVQQLEAMSNANTNPALTEQHFTKSMQEWEEKIDGKFAQFANTINHNTNTKVDAATDTLIHHAVNIQEIISNMAMEFQTSQQRMHAITQNLAMSLPNLYQRLPTTNQHGPSTSITTTHTGGHPLQLQAPPGYHGPPQHNYPQNPHQGYNPPNE